MREIKFRACIGGKMLDNFWLCNDEEKGIGLFDDAGPKQPTLCEKPYTLMQFTGLKDKNGKEIYEGDIVRRQWEGQNDTHHEEIYEVYWANGYYLKPQPKAHPSHVSSDVEVIGNIYENPELLK
jgi:YopX protein